MSGLSSAYDQNNIYKGSATELGENQWKRHKIEFTSCSEDFNELKQK